MVGAVVVSIVVVVVVVDMIVNMQEGCKKVVVEVLFSLDPEIQPILYTQRENELEGRMSFQ